MKKVTYFREKPLINRKNEINFIKDYFTKLPERILWIYGPKSTGKTTLIEYIVENELFDDFKLFKSSKYNVKYINFRRNIVANYDTFVDSLLMPDDIKLSYENSAEFNIGIFKISAKEFVAAKEKKVDVFKLLKAQFESSNKRNVLIIDEIQVLQDIYINGGKILLNEFLNFLVSLTKETHLSHVVILSSNTIFINEIYENAKLKKTSKFYKIDHLNYDEVYKWLKGAWDNPHIFSDNEIKLIWDYLGGSIAHIQFMLTDFCELKTHSSLQEYLENEAKLALSDFRMCFREKRRKRKDNLIEDEFVKVAKEIIANGYAILKKDTLFDEMLDFFCEKEILFFEPSDTKVYPNSRIYVKGMEKLVLSAKH
jgi:AAA+ ATPase superfamily predicted ATPase